MLFFLLSPIQVYPEGHDELYLRVGSPSWKPVRLTDVQAKKCRQDVSWVRRHGARLIPFRYVHDEWARLGVQGTGQTLKDVAEEARCALAACVPPGILPHPTPLRADAGKNLSWRVAHAGAAGET